MVSSEKKPEKILSECAKQNLATSHVTYQSGEIIISLKIK